MVSGSTSSLLLLLPAAGLLFRAGGLRLLPPRWRHVAWVYQVTMVKHRDSSGKMGMLLWVLWYTVYIYMHSIFSMYVRIYIYIYLCRYRSFIWPSWKWRRLNNAWAYLGLLHHLSFGLRHLWGVSVGMIIPNVLGFEHLGEHDVVSGTSLTFKWENMVKNIGK